MINQIFWFLWLAGSEWFKFSMIKNDSKCKTTKEKTYSYATRSFKNKIAENTLSAR